MNNITKLISTALILIAFQAVPTTSEAAHRGNLVDNGFGPGINNGNQSGGGNSGNGGGNGGNTTDSGTTTGSTGSTTGGGGAQGAPAPLLAASLFGQAIAVGGSVVAWRRRKRKTSKIDEAVA